MTDPQAGDPAEALSSIEHLLQQGPVIPVLVIDHLESAVPLARALSAGGLRVLEITLRTSCALQAISAIADAVPEVWVGAGTVNSAAQVQDAARAGARFLVSPGSTPRLLDALEDSGLPFLPGAVTSSEVLQMLERGHRHLKFFPAEAAGGAPVLKALSGPFPQVKFCPTGGIDLRLALGYLRLSTVPCVGGSWVAPADAVATGDWSRITALALEATRLRAGL
jgi:2-dehydro-3-deoxyphosphogluconate aldolase/(4S)-4-hydroxy-2-oxoglutarate aldolase